MNNLSSDCLFKIGKVPVGTGTTDVVSNIIDLEGAIGATWILDLGTVGAGNVVTLAESDNSDMSSPSNVGTTITGGTVPTTSNRLVVVEAIQPLKRYQQLTLTRPAATIVNTILVVTPMKKRPVSQLSTIVSLVVRLIKGQ